ncbi:hypothetical protein BCR44DRAFT_1516787 [Catenaria anguillulae PL171]|uniref:MINDY deubiquitinase domain-containing protein n=1 Tax=Catenaria anguillulae PL171 TaxID=765915 RepID=A0A1Y2H7T2_9FUNG|nr:hypothetical protein BCR44DRAFT_1516787 [Catenaria anguillulae PL171]
MISPTKMADDSDLLQIACHLPLPLSPSLVPLEQPEPEPEQEYRVKEILFADAHLFPPSHTPSSNGGHAADRDKRTRILMQNANGPCPLLAIANILALRGHLVIPLGEPTVSYSFLAHRLGEYLLSSSSTSPPASPTLDTAAASSSSSPRTSKLDLTLSLLPTLQHGLTINPCFDHVTSIDTSTPTSPAPSLFAAFHIPLVHAWTCDPQDTLAWSVLGPEGPGRSFNHASVLALAHPPTHASEIAREWLDSTRGQITVHGLVTLASAVDNGLYALFRNNHFHVMYKRGHGEVYTLVTDEGYTEVQDVVWEKVEGVDGESKLCTGDFTEWDPNKKPREVDEHVPVGLMLGVGHGFGSTRHVDAGSMVGTVSSRSGTAGTDVYLPNQPPPPAGFESEQERADREYALALQQAEDAAATLPVSSPTAVSSSSAAAPPSRRPSANPGARVPQQSAPVYVDPSEAVGQTAGHKKKDGKAKDCLVM